MAPWRVPPYSLARTRPELHVSFAEPLGRPAVGFAVFADETLVALH